MTCFRFSSEWHALGEGIDRRNGSVETLAFYPAGELYAVGFFTETGGPAVQHVALWDDETWHALGP